MTNLLTPSIELRATEYMLKGMDALEAVGQALRDEIELGAEMVAGRTERAKLAKERMFEIVCKKINKK